MMMILNSILHNRVNWQQREACRSLSGIPTDMSRHDMSVMTECYTCGDTAFLSVTHYHTQILILANLA